MYEDESSFKREDLPDRIPLRLAFPWTRTTVLYSFTVDTGRWLDSFRIGLTSEVRDGSADVPPFDPFDPSASTTMLTDNPRQTNSASLRYTILLLRLPLFLPLTRASTPYFSKIFNAAFSVLYANSALPPLFRDSTNRPTPLPSRPLYRLGLRSTGQGKSCDVITGCGDLRETLLPSHERIRVTSRNWAIVRVLRSELERSNFSFGL